jgi:hypothetical protein
VSDEDGFAKPESALLESDSSESEEEEEEEEESESLESVVSRPLLLASISNGLESSDSAYDESESSDSASDDSDPDDSEPSGLASGGPNLSDSAPEGSESQSGPGEQRSQDSKHSVSLPLSEGPGEDSEPPSGASTGAEPPAGPPALWGSSPQSSLMRLGPVLQARSARRVAVRARISQGRLSMGGPSWWHCRAPPSSDAPWNRSPTRLRALSTLSTTLSIHALASLWPFTLTLSSSGPPKRA